MDEKVHKHKRKKSRINIEDIYGISFELNSTSDFQVGVTDVGLCHVLNGEDMRSTFIGTDNMRQLWTSLDKRESVKASYIKGSGKIYEKTFWLDIGDR